MAPRNSMVGGSLLIGHTKRETKSRDELVTLLIDDDQGIYRTDTTRVDQPFPLNLRDAFLKFADVLAVEFEELRSNFHAVRSAHAERPVDADREIVYFPFDEILDDCPSFRTPCARPVMSLTACPLTRNPTRVSPLRTSVMDPRGDRRQRPP